MTTEKLYENIHITTDKSGVATITGSILLSAIQAHSNKEFKKIQKEFKLPGFRPGHVPEEVVREHIHESDLFQDAAQNALNEAYPHILEESGLHPLTYPRVEITKIALGNPLEFKLEIGITPEFSLPNYQKLAKEVSLTVEPIHDEEIAQIMKEIEEARSTETEKFTLTDETVSQVGKFENLEDFKTKLATHVGEEKKENAKMKRREAIGLLLLEKTKLELPKLWEDDQRHEVLHTLEHHAEDNHLSKDALLEKLGKTEEALIQEEIGHIAKQEKIKMILDKIADAEKITVSEEEVARETLALEKYYQGADPDRLHHYSEEALRRQKALEFLETIQ